MRLPAAALLVALSLALATAHAQAPDAARRLARDATIVDTHIDAPSELVSQWHDLGIATPTREFDYPKARDGGLDVAFMSIYTSADQDEAGTASQAAQVQIDAVEALVQRHPDKFALLRSPRDFKRLQRGGKVLLALGMENGAPIGNDLAQLAVFHARGVRYITLAHGRNNRISDSATDTAPRWHGLSPFGRDVVAEMNRLGIMVDVSHLSEDAIQQAVELSRVPVIASHSALRHFTPGFQRNLSDASVKAIAAKGGVVQVPFGSIFIDAQAAETYSAFLREREAYRLAKLAAQAAGKPVAGSEPQFPPLQPTSIAAVLDNIDRVVQLAGIDHVGIGSDFDGVNGALAAELRTVADYPALVAGLQQRGYGEGDIRKILGGNLLRVWGEVERAAAR
ncbi:dipeptidase [Lysobacter solisilvae (ex Woo and Kim 2020)]|uniref:Dipeptidase n=1 Tax=Agrilutibacter terrestris TaxID=2865112 RepID=A0A7H0FVB4_9GAMM|nr:dipeptidase [Lysobacter terrestris]QNP39980.1 dipeptidase [Lysobacter terrestris]